MSFSGGVRVKVRIYLLRIRHRIGRVASPPPNWFVQTLTESRHPPFAPVSLPTPKDCDDGDGGWMCQAQAGTTDKRQWWSWAGWRRSVGSLHRTLRKARGRVLVLPTATQPPQYQGYGDYPGTGSGHSRARFGCREIGRSEEQRLPAARRPDDTRQRLLLSSIPNAPPSNNFAHSLRDAYGAAVPGMTAVGSLTSATNASAFDLKDLPDVPITLTAAGRKSPGEIGTHRRRRRPSMAPTSIRPMTAMDFCQVCRNPPYFYAQRAGTSRWKHAIFPRTAKMPSAGMFGSLPPPE